ncbi:hypothetical protein [Streptomyces sp. ME19-01-6]|uniref:hypothetical protein n=1 Tax=Streptomyces sp. ME19-01-6 TaxID=3028686 RepID=UPI0029A15CCC|nr:hypothetical protein [Streptomyces sp. ME19-01-6]MDX3231524.1 hypothetical protein [Streptomyces sp. ME19-01-6]
MTNTYSPIPELNLLAEFEGGVDDLYAAGFSLDDTFGRDNTFLKDPELEDRLILFAEANASGSLYVLWRVDDRADLATLPVALLGDEGGIHLVARNVREFLRFLASLEEEPCCDWEGGVGFRRSEPTPCRAEYIAWLDRHFGLAPLDDAYDSVEAALTELGKAFTTWIYPLIPEAVYSPCHELNLLWDFEENLDDDYAAGFGLAVEYGEYGYGEAPENPELADRLVPFALANSSGSLYALWRVDDRTDLATLPVVVLGGEDGIHLIARDLCEFLQFLASLEGEPWNDGGRIAFRDGEASPGREEYVAWLDRHFGLAPVDDPGAVVEAAEAELGKRFATWLTPRIGHA